MHLGGLLPMHLLLVALPRPLHRRRLRVVRVGHCHELAGCLEEDDEPLGERLFGLL